MTRRFYVRTYGCQMNEHDSERIAGVLAADGMEATDDLASADVVVLNTCCIRENADNKLYAHLGDLKALKAQRPDLQIAVGGCLAQKDREGVRDRAPFVDVVFGTHNLAHAPELLRDARLTGPVVEILDEHEAYPSALPARRDNDHTAWVTIQIGCDNTCAFCIVPSVRGKEVSRRTGDILAEVEELARDGVVEITLLGQNVNSYGRDLGAGQFRPQFADLLRSLDTVEGIERIRFTSPHPKDLRAETVAAMGECAHVCEHLHLPLQSGSDDTLARMHRGYTAERYLERLRAARAAVADLAVTTDIIVGFPGETEADFERTLAIADEAEYDAAYTFVFSPRPGTEAALMADRFVDPAVVQERMARLVEVVEGHALRKHEARGRAHRRGAGRGAVEEGPVDVVGPDAPEQVGALRAARVDPPRRARRRPGHERRTALPARRLRGASCGPRRAGVCASRSRWCEPPPRGRRPDRVGEVRGRARRRPRASTTSRSCRSTRCRCTEAWTSAPRSRRRADRAAVAHHLIDVADPSEEWSVRATQDAARAAVAGIEARGRRALLVGGTGLYVRAVVDGLRVPPRDPAVRATLEHETATADGLARAYERLALADPLAVSRIEPGNARRIVRALEVHPADATSRSRRSGRASPPYGAAGARRRVWSASGSRAPSWAGGSSARFAAMREQGLVAEVRTLAASPERRHDDSSEESSQRRAGCRARRRRRSGTRRCSPISTASSVPGGRLRPGRAPHPPVRPPPAGVVPARPSHPLGRHRP